MFCKIQPPPPPSCAAYIRRQAIIETTAGLLSIGPYRNVGECFVKIQNISLKKMHLEISSGK